MFAPTALRRRIVTAALLGATVVGTVVGVTAPAHAAGPADRVINPSNNARQLLAPDRIAVGSPIRLVDRIGKADDTPPNQTWQTKPAPRGGGINIIAEPSTRSGRPLCIDLATDSKEPGVALVLRTCDGSASQAWNALGRNAAGNFMENQFSKLKMDTTGGVAKQNDFLDRSAPQSAKAAQIIDINPKSFGIGGA
jgi:hypothetical protein